MGIFNATATFLADLNLFFQIAVFAVLVLSTIFKFRLRFALHGATMAFAFILHTGSILIVMIPSILASRGLFENPLTSFAFTVLSHSILGSAIEMLGIYIVGTWVMHRLNPKNCFKNKKIMRITAFLWLIELIHGTLTYLFLYPI